MYLLADAMRDRDFHQKVLCSEEARILFLKQFGIFQDTDVRCPGKKDRTCGQQMENCQETR